MKDNSQLSVTNYLLKKMLTCLYIIITLLTIVVIVLFTSNVKITNNSASNTDSKSENNTDTSNDYDVSMFKKVNVDGVIELFGSKETNVIYIGRSTCGYCVKFLPILQKAQKDFGYKTYYLDITTVDNNQQKVLLEKDNDDKFLEENFGATPMVLLVKDGKIVEGWVGYSEYDSFAQYLTRNGFEKD